MNAIQKLGQIAVPVKDLDRAIHFYKEILGLPLLFQAGSLAFFDCNGVRLLLSPPESPEFDHPSSILYFQVADIKETYESLSSDGCNFYR